MNLNEMTISRALKSTFQEASAMFSVLESDFHYWIAVDLPTLPSTATEIVRSKEGLTVEGRMGDIGQKQAVFRCLPKGRGIKATYIDGVLWLLLPKSLAEQNCSALKAVGL